MLINTANLDAIRVGFDTSFQTGLGMAQTQYEQVATTVPSTTSQNTYGWLGKFPKLREWIGPRHVHGMEEHDYTIKNKTFELTIGVDRDDIEDDNLGVYTPLLTQMGQNTAAHPDLLVFDVLKKGFAENAYDGQFFFDTDHPVINASGAEVSVANTDGGAETPWYLLSTQMALKPIIYQQRRMWDFVSMDDPRDHNVFKNKEFQYGVDGRNNVGFGFWQMAWGSKQTLDADAYENGRVKMGEFKADHGNPLGIVPNLLVVPPSLEGAGRSILQSQLVNGGESNKWAGTAELLVVPWLA
jgi:phage major head subunit gpT-like protein